MALNILITKAASSVLTGAVGAAAYGAARKAAANAPIREAAVTVTEWGLRGARKLEEGAGVALAKASDVLAEAKGRVDESAAADEPAAEAS